MADNNRRISKNKRNSSKKVIRKTNADTEWSSERYRQKPNNEYKRKKAMLRRVHKKISVAFIGAVCLMLLLVIQILRINNNRGDEYAKAVLDHQAYTSSTISSKRGQIIDRNGTVMAYSEKVYNLILDPKLMLSDDKFKAPTVEALTKCFDISNDEIEEVLSQKKDSHYEKIRTNLTSDQIKEFKALLDDTKNNPYIKGVWFEDAYIRKYPFGSLACDTIGFASASNGGETGIESYYNDELTGTDGMSYSYVSDNMDVSKTTKDAVDGLNIVTTIDYNVQNIIEKHIKAYNEQSPSKNTEVIVMNPNNGEILGMSDYPYYDLNNPRDLSGIYTQDEINAMSDDEKRKAYSELWNNYCISQTFEPGSTFKPFTVAMGLEEGSVHDGDTFTCTGSMQIDDRTISCHKKSGHGTITLEQAVMQSCNPTMMQIAQRLGASKFSHYQTMFGFGNKTAIDLPGEESGILQPATMSNVSLATNAFGQTFNVTMVQMAAAMSSLVNGGYYYQPHVVKRIEKASGEVVKSFDATLVRQTVTDSTSQYIKKYLHSTVTDGLAKKAGVTGYAVLGKTGTAQKLPRSEKKWIISFIGCAPADDPQIVIYVVIDEPYGTNGTEGSSSDVLTLSHDILEELLPYMNIYKDVQAEPQDTSQSESEGTVTVPEQ